MGSAVSAEDAPPKAVYPWTRLPPLEEQTPHEVAAWLRRQRLPASFDHETVGALVVRNKVGGETLLGMTSRELRDVVGIQPLGWRKAMLRVLAVRRDEILRDALREEVALGAFSFRKESHQLQPLRQVVPRDGSRRWSLSFGKPTSPTDQHLVFSGRDKPETSMPGGGGGGGGTPRRASVDMPAREGDHNSTVSRAA